MKKLLALIILGLFLISGSDNSKSIHEIPEAAKVMSESPERKRIKYLTKWKLFITSIKWMFLFCLMLISFFGFIIGDIVGIMLIFVCFGICYSLASLRGIFHVIKQESTLGISFKEEMEKNQINKLRKKPCGTEKEWRYENESWFISVCWERIVVFRKDYIRKVGCVDYYFRMFSKVKITNLNGEELKVIAATVTLKDFKKWFYT